MNTLDFELKRADPDAGTFAGYASVFGNVDLGGDVVLPGAFAEVVRNDAGEVVTLWQHDSRAPIGLADVAEDARGLKIAGRLILEDPQAQVARAHMKAGSVRGLSIGYDVLPGGAEYRDGIRRLSRLKLYEVSLVTFAMNPAARVSRAKSALLCESVAELEDLLRDALVLPGRRAKRLASLAWPVLAGREAPTHENDLADLGPLAGELQSITQLIQKG